MSTSNPSETWKRMMRQTLHLLSTGLQPAFSNDNIIEIMFGAHATLRQKCDEIQDEDDSVPTEEAKRSRETDAIIAEIRRCMASKNISGHEITVDELSHSPADPAQKQYQQSSMTHESAASTVAFSSIAPTSAGCALCKQNADELDQIHPTPEGSRDSLAVNVLKREIDGEQCSWMRLTDAHDTQHYGWVTEQMMEDIERA